MRVADNSLVIVMQTVRLPHGCDQFVVPTGCSLSRGQLIRQLGQAKVMSEHRVVQPETGREGAESLTVLAAEALAETQQRELKNWLDERLNHVNEIIGELGQDFGATGGDLSTSSILTEWQLELRRHFGTASNGTASTVGKLSRSPLRRVITMSVMSLSLLLLLLLVPPIRDWLPHIGLKDGDTVKQEIKHNSYEDWQLPGFAKISNEEELLNAISPLVVVDETKTTVEQLVDVLGEIDATRLGVRKSSNEQGAGLASDRLRSFIENAKLREYVTKLFDADGAYIRFGIVMDDVYLPMLQQLLPGELDGKSATTYRDLVAQLIGIAPIGSAGKPINQLEDPFFDLASGHRRDFQAMAAAIPREYKQSSSRCTFFTSEDCAAARALSSYFTKIGFLHNDSLGFAKDDPRSSRLTIYASTDAAPSHHFARLLIDWKEFVTRRQVEAVSKPIVTDEYSAPVVP